MHKYFAVFTLSFIHSLRNYKTIGGLSIFLITCLVIFAHLWKIAAAKTGVAHLLPEELLWYIAFNEWVLVSTPDIQEEMEHDMRIGRLAYLLPRPISYLGSMYAEAVGTLSAHLIALGAVAFVFTRFYGGGITFSIEVFPIMLLFGFLSGLLAILFQMCIGLSAFWLHEVSPFYWIWEKLLFMFGGLMLPLTVYPQWMQVIAQCTPFPAILGQRSALVIDCTASHIAMLAFSYIAWGFVGILLLQVLYRRGLYALNIEGG